MTHTDLILTPAPSTRVFRTSTVEDHSIVERVFLDGHLVARGLTKRQATGLANVLDSADLPEVEARRIQLALRDTAPECVDGTINWNLHQGPTPADVRNVNTVQDAQQRLAVRIHDVSTWVGKGSEARVTEARGWLQGWIDHARGHGPHA